MKSPYKPTDRTVDEYVLVRHIAHKGCSGYLQHKPGEGRRDVTFQRPASTICQTPRCFYKMCFWERLFNRWVMVFKNGEVVFNFPARKLPKPAKFGDYLPPGYFHRFGSRIQ